MTPTEEQVARSAIRHVLSIYNNSGDRGQIDDLLTAFASDGVLEVPGATYQGHAEIAAFLSGVATGVAGVDLRGSRHHLTTSRIEFETTGAANGWTYFFVMRAGQVLQEGMYVDRYILDGTRWLIGHRRVKMLFSL